MSRPASSAPDAVSLVVVGSVNQDVIARVERLPHAGETVGRGALTVQPGGKGANQAVAAARLGARVSLVGAVGDDAAGRDLVESLRGAGVSVERTAVATGVPTGTALIVVDAEGENQIAVCPGANDEIRIDHDDIPSDAIVLTQLEVPFETVLTASRAGAKYFALNAAPARPLPAELIERCDLIIVNETEYSEIPDLSAAPLVAVTYGSDGAALVEHGREILRVPAVRATVVNSVGAGDAFCAALTLGLAAGVDPWLAVRVANEVGADAVASEASQPPLLSWGEYASRVDARVGAPPHPA